MKLTCLFCNLIIQYLFLCLLITSTNSQQLSYQHFNYTETKLGDHSTPPLIADIKTYDDGTILVHIIRNESTQSDGCSNVNGMSLE
ncbi:20696_t:CDS:1, partial [Gigaspora rosea]